MRTSHLPKRRSCPWPCNPLPLSVRCCCCTALQMPLPTQQHQPSSCATRSADRPTVPAPSAAAAPPPGPLPPPSSNANANRLRQGLKSRDANWTHLGNLGPLIRASVGDVVRVVFRNNLDFAVNFAPAGLVPYDDAATGMKSARAAPVAPGATVTYLFRVPAEAGPAAGTNAVNSRLWLYRSSVDPTLHDNAGLVGPIIITATFQAQADGTPVGVDREVITVLQVVWGEGCMDIIGVVGTQRALGRACMCMWPEGQGSGGDHAEGALHKHHVPKCYPSNEARMVDAAAKAHHMIVGVCYRIGRRVADVLEVQGGAACRAGRGARWGARSQLPPHRH